MKSIYFESRLCFYFPPFADNLNFHFDFPFPYSPPPPPHSFTSSPAAFRCPFFYPTRVHIFLYRVHILPLAGFWRPGANVENIEMVETPSAIILKFYFLYKKNSTYLVLFHNVSWRYCG
jgi:hypothetical protein